MGKRIYAHEPVVDKEVITSLVLEDVPPLGLPYSNEEISEGKKALPSHLQQLELIYSELKAQTDGTSEHIEATLKRKMQAIFHAIGVFK